MEKPNHVEPAIRIHGASERSVLRVKSWLPELSVDSGPLRINGWELPATVGRTLPGDFRVLCTAPGDWLVVSRDRLTVRAVEALHTSGARQGLALVDLSSGLSVLDMSGPAVRSTLSKGCGLDLDARAFRYLQCARTRLAQIVVVIDALENPDSFALYVARSHAHYLMEWVLEAALGC